MSTLTRDIRMAVMASQPLPSAVSKELLSDALQEIERLVKALEDFDDPSRFDVSVRTFAQAHLAQAD